MGKKVFKELLKETDVLVEGNPPKVMEELGLDYNSMRDINPALIVTSITAFGQTGPYRDFKATELVSFHIGGLGYGTPGEIEEPETHPPLKAAGHQGNVQAGITAASATMCALFARDFSGEGQHIDVSIQEPLLSAIASDIIAHTNRSETPTRIAALALRVPGRKPFLARDGFVTITMVQDHFWDSLKTVLGNPEWTELEIFNERESRRDNMDALYPLVEEWTQNYTMEELYQKLQVEGHIPSSPVHAVEDAVNHPHFVERGTFVEMEHPEIGEFRSPGPAYRFSETPWRVVSPAPSAWVSTMKRCCARGWGTPVTTWRGCVRWESSKLTTGEQHSKGRAREMSRLPLEGVRVADFTQVVQGPYATMMMAMMGAEIIKMETASRYPGDYPRRLGPLCVTT